jgi:hypothetical protein
MVPGRRETADIVILGDAGMVVLQRAEMTDHGRDPVGGV